MKFYIHKDGYFYSGDMTEGAREATQAEIDVHLAPQIVTQVVDENIVDLYQAMFDIAKIRKIRRRVLN